MFPLDKFGQSDRQGKKVGIYGIIWRSFRSAKFEVKDCALEISFDNMYTGTLD